MPIYSEPVNQQRPLPWQTLELRAPGALTPYEEAQAALKKRRSGALLRGVVLPVAAATGAAALPALFGGGVAAGGATSAGYSSPGIFGGLFGGGSVAPTVAGAGGSTLGSILNSDALGLGVGAVTNYFGNRAQNRANRYATDVNARNTAETLALERQRLEQEALNANLDREDARKLNEAINELKRRELDAAEEDRAYNRSLMEARELRAAPRREMSARAMRSLGAILGI